MTYMFKQVRRMLLFVMLRYYMIKIQVKKYSMKKALNFYFSFLQLQFRTLWAQTERRNQAGYRSVQIFFTVASKG
jgi:hypothetical protein